MGLGVHQEKNVAEMRAAVLTRRRCGFDTRPPHHGASGQRAGCQSLLERGKLSFRCVTKRKDAWRPGQTGISWGARFGHGNTGIPHWPVQLRLAPPIPGWTHPGSTSEGCEAPSREDGAKRTRNGEAHNAPQAWSGPQRHGVSSPPRGMTPTLPLHHLFGAGGPLAHGELVLHLRFKRAYFMG